MAKKRLRLKIPQLIEALDGHQMNDHHRWLIDQGIEHAKLLDRQGEALEAKIDEYLKPYRRQYELLMTIPGIRETAAANILAEIGPDMSQFPTSDNLCSWAGICSGNNRSAGKSKSSHIKKANKFLLAALVEAAWVRPGQRVLSFSENFTGGGRN
jgi:transposase